MSLLLSWLDFMKGMVGPLKFGTWAWKMLSYIPIWLGGKVNVLALPDEDFVFLCHLLTVAQKRPCNPTSMQEAYSCDSLCNFGVLRKSDRGYKLTWLNRHLAKIQAQ